MAAIDWTHIYKKYKGLWVGLAQDEKTVLAFGKTAKGVFDKAQKKGYPNPILTKMPQKLVNYVGSSL